MHLQWLMACAKDVKDPSPDRNYCSEKIKINMESCVQGMFAAATVMISFGAVLGKLSVLQMLVMAICECSSVPCAHVVTRLLSN
jgi:hypothetical protein